MTPSDIRALAARVEAEDPTEELRVAVLDAFGCDPDWDGAPNPLVSVDDAKSFQPDGWEVYLIRQAHDGWCCALCNAGCRVFKFEEGKAPTEPRARTAAGLRALAWDKENAGG
jgi:hypothetical protein